MADYIETKNAIALEKLAHLLMSGRKVLFVTGAGLSVSSGISTYRSSKDAIWDRFITDWGTRKKFREDPLRWWNEFWLQTHEKNEFLQAQPNAGHFAISHIIHRCNANIITQNIDRLHVFTLRGKSDRLAEVHGRLGLYKCITPDCRYTHEESITARDIDLDELAVKGTSMNAGNLQLREPPICPDCQQPVLPQSLLFDELYESHSHYNWDKCLSWMEEADVFIFVGTSFSVGITAEAIDIAEKGKKIVFNFNLAEENFDCETYNVIGKSEETLPRLYNFMMILAGKPRLYFYPMSNGSYGIPPGSRQSAFNYSLKL